MDDDYSNADLSAEESYVSEISYSLDINRFEAFDSDDMTEFYADNAEAPDTDNALKLKELKVKLRRLPKEVLEKHESPSKERENKLFQRQMPMQSKRSLFQPSKKPVKQLLSAQMKKDYAQYVNSQAVVSNGFATPMSMERPFACISAMSNSKSPAGYNKASGNILTYESSSPMGTYKEIKLEPFAKKPQTMKPKMTLSDILEGPPQTQGRLRNLTNNPSDQNSEMKQTKSANQRRLAKKALITKPLGSTASHAVSETNNNSLGRINSITFLREPPSSTRLIKAPTMVKVPLAKLINTQQSDTAVKLVKNPQMVKVPNSIANMSRQDFMAMHGTRQQMSYSKAPQFTMQRASGLNVPKTSPNKSQPLSTHRPETMPKLKQEISMDEESATNQSKSMQTDFSFSKNMCGYIDVENYNINCLYCTQVFILSNWSSFIAHLSLEHGLEEDDFINTKQCKRSAAESYLVEQAKQKCLSYVNSLPDHELKNKNATRFGNVHEKEHEYEKDVDEVFNSYDMDDVLHEVEANEHLYNEGEGDATLEGNQALADNSLESNESAFLEQQKNLSYSTNKSPMRTSRNNKNLSMDMLAKKLPQISIRKVNDTAKEERQLATEDTKCPASIDRPVSTSTGKRRKMLQPLEDKKPAMKSMQMPRKMDSNRNTLQDKVPLKSSTNSNHSSDLKKFDDNSASIDLIDTSDIEMDLKIEPVFGDFSNEHLNKMSAKANELRSKDKAKQLSAKPKRRAVPKRKSKHLPENVESDDEMPSNDDDEDEMPSATNGCGILFGLTNRKIVMEFIDELHKYPELWKFNLNGDVSINYNDSIGTLCNDINERFGIDMSEFETRLSVQRIKRWYCRNLRRLERSKDNEETTFTPNFPEYFQKLDKFLSSDSDCTRDLVLGKRFQQQESKELQRYPPWMVGAAKIYSSKDGKQQSDNNQTVPEPFICDVCFQDFESKTDLTAHKHTHFPAKFQCSKCKAKHYTALEAAGCQHSFDALIGKLNSSLFVCEICGASYRSMSSLNCHRKDKHFNQRHRCQICSFSAISKCRLLMHQSKHHVVEYGTCEEIAKRTRPRSDSKTPFTAEARAEFEWRREMRKTTKPGELFYGCFSCKMTFASHKERLQHNRSQHPITETTVVCLLCRQSINLFSNSNSVRKHYTNVHKVPWDKIDDLVKTTKPLCQLLTPFEIDMLKSSENPYECVIQHLGDSENRNDRKNHRAHMKAKESAEDSCNYLNEEDMHVIVHEEDSNDNDYAQSTLYSDIGIEQDENEDVDVDVDVETADNDDDDEQMPFHGFDIDQTTQGFDSSYAMNYLDEDASKVFNEYHPQQVDNGNFIIEEDMQQQQQEEFYITDHGTYSGLLNEQALPIAVVDGLSDDVIEEVIDFESMDIQQQ